MDAVVGLLDGVRARGAFVLRMMMDPPWSMSIRDDAPLTLICQTHGSSVIVGETSGTVSIGPGDVALTRGTQHYLFADDPATAPMVVIHPGQRCTTLSGEDLHFEMSLGVRTWGNSDSGSSRSVVCAYEGHSQVSGRLLDALPAVAVLRVDEWNTPLVGLLADEAGRDGAGQEAYLDRLLDVLLIAVLRTWFGRDANAPTWWHAEQDRVVGPALRLIYNNPAYPWTVANLAAAVSCSRATFARRFTEQVGEPPIAFLTGWRLALAADLLRSSRATIASVARQVGYSTPFALSSAFKRAYGVSPNTHRRAALTSGGAPVAIDPG
ncbi:AraC family transcriptional regulator [Mycobacterium sp. 21AC1]|uniref:AraC family transcriptional regulator n=1 Tax=[Mycobacterium] appelbergii TaxID=2939269 RepID=UPI0029394568|nr:AraC family transcriptional regulator [Mycobacterium sp. 21AC1]MDV3123541.1 AraC family transcriptional regulator [Mycobacterium sp. 21AC1]